MGAFLFGESSSLFNCPPLFLCDDYFLFPGLSTLRRCKEILRLFEEFIFFVHRIDSALASAILPDRFFDLILPEIYSKVAHTPLQVE